MAKAFLNSMYSNKVLNLCLLLCFLFGYLEWGKGQHVFIFQAQAEIFLKATKDIRSVLHPLILIPFIGQLLLLYTIFQSRAGRLISLVGLACLASLMLLLFIIGLLSHNSKIAGSTIPFIITAFFVVKYNWKKSAGK